MSSAQLAQLCDYFRNPIVHSLFRSTVSVPIPD